MKAFFLSLKQQLLTTLGTDNLPIVKYIQKWNQQLRLLYAEGGAKIQAFPMPAVFIAFITADIEQLGEGVQLYDPLIFEIHILHWQLDAGDGTFEQNLDVFDFKQKVFHMLQKFQPGIQDPNNPAGSCIRISETEDNDHPGVFHFIQRYRTTYVDNLMQEPVGGSLSSVPLALEIDLDRENSEDSTAPHIYNYAMATYAFDSATTGNPAAGKIQLNNADPSLATLLYINNNDAKGLPIGDLLEEAKVGDTIKITKDGSNFILYKVSAIEQTIGQTNFTVTFVSATGTIANNDPITFLII